MLLCVTAIQDDNDRNTVERLYCENHRWMLYIAQKILRDRDKAEDAVSQAFVKIIDKLQKFSFEDCRKTKGLIAVLVKDICYDMLKAEKYRNFVPLDDCGLTDGSDDFSYDHLISEENYRTMMDALAGLNEKSGSVLKLKYIYGYSDPEIAEFLNISPENVRIRLHRAKAALLRALEEKGCKP